ncbi:uncharacterized protein LOC117661164 [Pantherophis guttatus]|uniref:Uncharacterized protein LOC117661164 n=1 Tax=Pantherophis guttatus TaxID=94885 RepID=A0A6P9B3S0_PANGU|nr:uncharacterized protein LOC117661164 [Pantherophis guttatus]
MASDFANILQVPSVDAPVVALSSASPLTGPSEEFLRPEDKKFERSLVKDHQASAWSIQASLAASFFNRASILWLHQLQERLPPSDMRSHQDINKILTAVEFSANATLNAARFSAKAIGASVTSHRLLWLRQWQADVRNKWRLASAPFSGNNLFGLALDPLLIETKDHRKILPALSRRSDPRQQGSFRSHSFRSDFSSFQSRPQRYSQPRGGQQQDFQEHVRGQSPLDSSSSPVLGMVDLSGSCSGMPVQSASAREHHHGREPLRMRGSPGVSDGPRAVVGPGEGTSHQHLGAQSHLPSSSQVPSSPSRSGCLDQNRQRSCQGPHQPARRDPLQGSHEGGISSLQVGGESLGIHSRLSHLRVSKCSGRRFQSLGGGQTEWSLDPLLFQDIVHRFGLPAVDLFASESNHQLPRFYTRFPVPGAKAVDALISPWPCGLLLYAFPPLPLISRVIRKLLQEQAELILLAPFWPRQPWFADLMALSVAPHWQIPADKISLWQSRLAHPDPQWLRLTVGG